MGEIREQRFILFYLEINFFVAVWTGLLLADYAPASDAELVELVAAGQS